MKEKQQAAENGGRETGQLVRSLAGRDAGNYFMVAGSEGEYVFLADGDIHKLAKPKKKKRKHIKSTGVVFDIIRDKLDQGKKVFDSEVYSSIKKALHSSGESEK